MNKFKKSVLSILLALSACTPTLAPAVNWAPDPSLTEEEQAVQNQWYKRVLINSGQTSCCGKGDAYYADQLEFIQGADYFYATITDDREVPNRVDLNGQRIKVPFEVIDRRRQGNPTGHNVIFVAPRSDESSELSLKIKPVADKDYFDEQEVSIYCFFPDQGN